MKSYKVVEFGQPLQKVEAPNPSPKGSEVLVRVTAAGVCHSDVHLWEGYFDMGGGNKVSTQKTMNRFNYIFRFGITPLFLFSGTFFPVDQLPG